MTVTLLFVDCSKVAVFAAAYMPTVCLQQVPSLRNVMQTFFSVDETSAPKAVGCVAMQVNLTGDSWQQGCSACWQFCLQF